MTDHSSTLVSVPRADLERVRDLLMERIYGSNARSPGHNARLEVEAMLSAPAAPQAAGVEFSVDDLAQEIRRVDGNHDLGAGALSEALMPFLFLRAPSREPEGGAALRDIISERRRQIDVEGWTAEHDDEHDDYSLGLAASAYAGGVDCGSKVATYTDDVSGGRGETPVWGGAK